MSKEIRDGLYAIARHLSTNSYIDEPAEIALACEYMEEQEARIARLEEGLQAAVDQLVFRDDSPEQTAYREGKRTALEVLKESPSQSAASIKAVAVMRFASTQVNAFDGGFIDSPVCHVGEVYQFACQHVKDNYNFEAKPINEEWSEELANELFNIKGEADVQN